MSAVVFDLDGTLIDSAGGIALAVNAALAEMDRAPLSLAQVTGFIGNGVPVLIGKVADATGLDDAARDALLPAFRRHYDADPTAGSTLFPGVRECLDGLAGAGLRIGLCTNKPERPTYAMLEALRLRDLFDVVIGGDTLPQRKPDPAPLHLAFARLGAPGVYVGDSEVDAACAAAAGIPFCLFTEGYRKTPVAELPHQASFDSFAVLPELLRQMA